MYTDSVEVAAWPEWKAFAKRMGIASELDYTRLVLTLEVGYEVRVEQVYFPRETKQTGDKDGC
jgi:hypothetical protein